MSQQTTVLIATSDQSVSRLLETVLKNDGLVAVVAKGLDDASAALKKGVNLALVDYEFAEGRGIDFVRGLAAEHGAVPVGMLARWGTPRSALAARHAGVRRFLLTPFNDAAAVGRTIRELLGKDPAGVVPGPSASPAKLGDGQRARVIVADTSEKERQALVEALEALGCEVTTATCGQEALLKLSEGSHEALVVDFDMGDMTADDILMRARRVDEDIAVIVTASDPSVSLTTGLFKKGASGFLEKPLADPEVSAEAVLRQALLVVSLRRERAEREKQEAAVDAKDGPEGGDEAGEGAGSPEDGEREPHEKEGDKGGGEPVSEAGGRGKGDTGEESPEKGEGREVSDGSGREVGQADGASGQDEKGDKGATLAGKEASKGKGGDGARAEGSGEAEEEGEAIRRKHRDGEERDRGDTKGESSASK